MSLLYKKQEDLTYKIEVTLKDSKINLLFSADCGKHGTDEVLDEYDLTPLELLNILQGNEELNKK